MREEFALEALETCKIYGVLAKFQNRAAGPTSQTYWLWMIPDKIERKMYSDGALDEEQTTRQFFIPFQRGCGCQSLCNCSERRVLFPPEGDPSVDSIIWFENQAWATKSFTADSLRAGYTLTTVRHLPRRVEVAEEEN